MDELPIYIIDDDAAVLASLEHILSQHGARVRTYSSADKFVAECVSLSAACLLLDLQMPGMTGLDLMDWLKANHIDIPVIILSGHSDVPAVVDSIKRGAVDYILKPVKPDLLVEKVRALVKSSQERVLATAKLQEIRDRFAKLTQRERELLDWIAQGLSSKQIAVKFNISVKTVENHRSHLLAKTRAVNVASLIHMRQLVADANP